jgi:hypothetical protein
MQVLYVVIIKIKKHNFFTNYIVFLLVAVYVSLLQNQLLSKERGPAY